MKHLHKRFSADQLKVLFSAYLKGRLTRIEVEEELGIGKTQFFARLKQYKKDPHAFSLLYLRHTTKRLSAIVEQQISSALNQDKALIDNPHLPITTYNYSAVRDRLTAEHNSTVGLNSIIRRAKALGFYQHKKTKRIHDREVITTAIGALIQHDSSNHLWSPYATEKWILITSLDDFSRKLLYADFVISETTWTHIQAAQRLIEQYGFPLRYYVDQLRVFRFIQGRDSIWRKHILRTDDVDPQWRHVMRTCGVDVIYALSPQAKGKIERPYRWLQDRIVRTCALEHITTIEQAREVLRHEVDRYNDQQIHSTTKEIPAIRFNTARQQGNSLFRPFTIPSPYRTSKDVFCLREKRMVNGYRKISLWNHELSIPHVPLREYVDICIIPDKTKQIAELRIWWDQKLVQTVVLPAKDVPSVHF